jgi:hypothetical protein
VSLQMREGVIMSRTVLTAVARPGATTVSSAACRGRLSDR